MAMNKLIDEQKKKAIAPDPISAAAGGGMKCCCCGKPLLNISSTKEGSQDFIQSCSLIEVISDGKFKCDSCSDIPEEVMAEMVKKG